MDVIKLLKDDHRRILALLKEVAAGQSDLERRSRFDQLERDLRRHEMVEEKMLYPALKLDAKGRDIVIEAHEAHLITARLLREMEDMPPTDERWVAKLNVLAEIFARHVKEEQRRIFPKIRGILDRQERDRLGTRIVEFSYAGARG